mmetsp:Transcript_20890/g.45692  ORF Transcript_20890/g.45692 Transcript_20890/m.45692 type:complete len:156 (-) Transcript_20890:1477-1944(-)|eukprot:CAMPEP_0202902870 /NCGR_PEP_ID=MMETSP1392-20130828/18272_1 /ASSEMBLY_ACC=CAM_ASM_000868 /TAXON_ID=225041 /ORGANISM="Chlamydomonas chlamydogama, Strain SAG 11-48b" /LENGTH=155 /DNA_ID=CAMNT_0049589719 /DNA_START=167 /DNA_END=634 /DNA_ORIENTATION=-
MAMSFQSTSRSCGIQRGRYAGSTPQIVASRRNCKVAAANSVTEVATVTKVKSISPASYHTFLSENNNKLSVVDFYTTWCGPCKLIAPTVEQYANDYSQVAFAKMDCGADNDSKKLAMGLGIKALPTFHLYKGQVKVAEMTGSKAEALKKLIEEHM